MNLEDVGNETFVRFNQAVMRKAGGDRKGIFHVSDLINPKCGRNIYYSKRDPLPRYDGETAKNFFGGNMVHEFTLLTKEEYHEQHIIYSPFEDKVYPYEKTVKEHPDKNDEFWYKVVIGTPDDIILEESSGEYYIADKKTKLSKPESVLFGKQYDSAKPEHKSQLSMYRLLFLRTKQIDCKYGCILSLDFSDKFVTPKTFAFELEDPQKTRLYMIERMTELTEYLKKKKLPERVVDQSNRWMCNRYCQYYSLCFDGAGKNI